MSLEYNPPAPEILYRAIQHALWLLQSKKRLYSFVIWESADDEGWEVFELDDYAESLARAHAYVCGLSDSVGHYALVYDGYLKIDGRRQDAIYLEVGEAGSSQAQLYVQPYAPKTLLRRAAALGEVIYLEPVKARLLSLEPRHSSGVWASPSFG